MYNIVFIKWSFKIDFHQNINMIVLYLQHVLFNEMLTLSTVDRLVKSK